MSGIRRFSRPFGAGSFVLPGLLFVLTFSCPGFGASVACIRNTAAALSHNGIVAPGAAGPCGAVGPVWPTVAPLEMQPAGSVPDGYLYVAYSPAGNRLFIGVDSSGDPDISNNDAIVIVFHSKSSTDFAAGDFYIRVPIIASNADINTGVACSQPAGSIDYFTYVGGTGWQHVDDPAVAAAINAKAAYRYDGGNKIWNLEIDMPVSQTLNQVKYFDLPATVDPDPKKRIFALGAYYFISQGNPPVGLNPKPLKWPDTMPDRQSFNDQSMQSLATPLAANQLADLNLSDVCLDVNFTVSNPWDIGGAAAKEFDHRVVRNAVNNFGVTFFFKGPGAVPGPLTNNGQVTLSLVPYSTSNHGPAWDNTIAVNADTFNQTKRVEFNLNLANHPQWNAYQPLNFLCATMTLHHFDHDDDLGNNYRNVNYNYFTTSEYTHQFYVFGDDVKNLKAGETGAVYLRIQPANEVQPGAAIGFTLFGPSTWNRMQWLLIAAFLLVCSAIIALIPRRRLIVGLLAALGGVAAVSPGCQRPPTAQTRWQIENSRELNLTPVKGERDLYRMPIARGESKRIGLRFTGMRLPYTPVHQTLRPAGPDGQPGMVRVPVKPGRVMTIIANGNINLDGNDAKLPPASPMGIILPRPGPAGETPAPAPAYLLRPGYYAPHEYAGALIGSFDNFESSFVVGRSASIVVPPNGATLSLAVNAIRGQYARIAGEYGLVIVDTDGPQVPTHTAIQGDATGHVPVKINPWDVLTSLNIYSYYETVVNPGGPVQRTLNPIGAVHYSVYESHVAVR